MGRSLAHPVPVVSFREDEATGLGGDAIETVWPEKIGDSSIRYTTDISDADLTSAASQGFAGLGSVSIGAGEAGRLVNGVLFPEGDGSAWTLIEPEKAFGTQETVDAVMLGAIRVKEKFPNIQPLRINHLGKEGGGYLRPHQSHQSGRDVDLGFYYKEGVQPGSPHQSREKLIDLAANWLLVRTLITETDVHFILVDKRIQRVLYDYALRLGEDKEWLASLFLKGNDSVFHHARGHKDHFHVRMYGPRSQELARRLEPIVAKAVPDEKNTVPAQHRVKDGETLGKIAGRYHTSIRRLESLNQLKSRALRIGQVLQIPGRSPIRWPLTPAVEVPPRHVAPFDPTDKPNG